MAIKLRSVVLTLVLSGLLSSCSISLEDTGIFVIYQTAVATFAPELEPTIVSTPAAAETFISVEVIDPTATIEDTSAVGGSENCNRAASDIPLDITVPDGTQLNPGQAFRKTWRLVNAGDCAWTDDYAAVWFSGAKLSQSSTQFLRYRVQPGGTLDVSVDMVAPEAPGFYQSNWMLSDANGNLFGLGPAGDAPLWVRIEVVPAAGALTSTATPALQTEIATQPAAFSNSLLTLQVEDRLNLDNGELNGADEADVILRQNGDAQLELFPERNTRIGFYGDDQPQEQECQEAELLTEEIVLDVNHEGEYLCYQSNQGLYGYIQLIDISSDTLSFNFLTWLTP
jgi:hypothetical protein